MESSCGLKPLVYLFAHKIEGEVHVATELEKVECDCVGSQMLQVEHDALTWQYPYCFIVYFLYVLFAHYWVWTYMYTYDLAQAAMIDSQNEYILMFVMHNDTQS